MTINEKGFTLIELLVVIAVMAVFVALAVPMYQKTKDKSSDAAIRDNAKQLFSQAQILNTANGCFSDGSVCPAPSFGPADCATAASPTMFVQTTIAQQLANMKKAGGGSLMSCASTGLAWAIAVQLKTDRTQAWCVDSSGIAKQITDMVGSVPAVYTLNDLKNAITGAACQ
jgi:prepilin-type N-terminal cleavage/methylation domain-containing protein